MNGHVIVCGLDSLGLRLVQELQRLGEDVIVIVDDASPNHIATVTKAGFPIIRGQYCDEDTLVLASVADAKALALVEQDDVGNLHAALMAQELSPGLHLVMRVFNDSIRRSAEVLLHDCVALSASAIAAPLFVAAAVGDEEDRRIDVRGHRLAIGDVGEIPNASILMALARRESTADWTLLPSDGIAPSDLALYEAGTIIADPPAPDQARSLRRQLSARLRATSVAVSAIAEDQRFRWLLLAILFVIALSVAVFTLFAGLSFINAVYFTITTITTTGYGDITVLNQSLPIKIYGIALIVVGATVLAIFYALFIDAVVGVRLSRALGGIRGHLRNHIVLCGLGNVGLKVAEQLKRRGLDVVAVELDEGSSNVLAARRLGIPVIIADASHDESLRLAQVEEAACLIALTNGDIINLEAALNARDLCPDLRVVLRLFDHDLAARVDRTFNLSISRSVSSLAAPAFAAALMGRQVLSVIPIGHHVLVVAVLAIEPGSELDGAAIEAVERPEQMRVLCCETSSGEIVWMPSATSRLSCGDRLTVVATRPGLTGILTRARERSDAHEA